MEKQQKAYTGVVEYFRKKIMCGELRLGEKLPPEREIAETLGVSRHSVREAIRIMDMTGVISSQQGSGNYITCQFQKSITETMAMMLAMDQIDYRQISQVRYSLEMLAFTLALDKADDKTVCRMEEYVKKLDKSGDSKINSELDKKIHYTLAEASKNILLLDVLEACSGVIDKFIEDMRYEILRTEKRKGMLNECHRQIVEAMREKNEQKGLAALKRHFDMINNILDNKM